MQARRKPVHLVGGSRSARNQEHPHPQRWRRGQCVSRPLSEPMLPGYCATSGRNSHNRLAMSPERQRQHWLRGSAQSHAQPIALHLWRPPVPGIAKLDVAHLVLLGSVGWPRAREGNVGAVSRCGAVVERCVKHCCSQAVVSRFCSWKRGGSARAMNEGRGVRAGDCRSETVAASVHQDGDRAIAAASGSAGSILHPTSPTASAYTGPTSILRRCSESASPVAWGRRVRVPASGRDAARARSSVLSVLRAHVRCTIMRRRIFLLPRAGAGVLTSTTRCPLRGSP